MSLLADMLVELEYALLRATLALDDLRVGLTPPKGKVHEDDDMLGYIMDGGI